MTALLEFSNRIYGDWEHLADYFGISRPDRAGFKAKYAPQDLLEWLEARQKLSELPDALTAIERADLLPLVQQILNPKPDPLPPTPVPPLPTPPKTYIPPKPPIAAPPSVSPQENSMLSANAASQFSWLHLSDFHFKTGDPYDRRRVLTALLESIQQHRESGDFQADAIFITGDLAQSGKQDEYKLLTQFLDKLLIAAGVEKKALFVVPGNHDTDRNAGKGLARTINSDQESTDFFGPDHPKHHFAKLKNFRAWYGEYFKDLRTWPEDTTCQNPFVLEAQGLKVGVLSINTALFSQGDDDHNKLWIGKRCLDGALEQLKKQSTAFNVALFHHPLDWLHDAERTTIQMKLQKHTQFLLRGHLHESGLAILQDPTSQSVHLSGGAGYQGSQWPNRALLCTLDLGKQELGVLPLRYEDTPEAWTLDTSLFSQNGKQGYQGTFKVPNLNQTFTTDTLGTPFNPVKRELQPVIINQTPSVRKQPMEQLSDTEILILARELLEHIDQLIERNEDSRTVSIGGGRKIAISVDFAAIKQSALVRRLKNGVELVETLKENLDFLMKQKEKAALVLFNLEPEIREKREALKAEMSEIRKSIKVFLARLWEPA